MYAYLKDNSFYIRMENDGLFLKNSYSDINVATPKSYNLFLAFIKYLDGKNDIDALINNINNQSVKNFYKEMFRVLKEQRFVLYDDNEIDISKYSDDEKQLLYYFGNLKDWKRYDDNNISILVEGPDESLVNVFSNLFGKRIRVESSITNQKYICINLNMEHNVEKLYIYKELGGKELMVSSELPDDTLDENLNELPFHVFEVIGALLEIEIWLKVHNAPVEDFFEKDYSFDLKILNGKHVERTKKNAS